MNLLSDTCTSYIWGIPTPHDGFIEKMDGFTKILTPIALIGAGVIGKTSIAYLATAVRFGRVIMGVTAMLLSYLGRTGDLEQT